MNLFGNMRVFPLLFVVETVFSCVRVVGWEYGPPAFFFKIQLYVTFKISAHMRQAYQLVGRKREIPEKNHMAHPQAELGLSHMWPERGSTLHQTQR